MLKKFVFKKISTSSKLHRYVNKVRKLYHARYICNGKRDPKIINLNKMTIPKKAYLLRQVCFAGCRLQVAGCGLKFNYCWKTAGTQMKRTSGRLIPWLLHDPVYDRTARLLPPYAKPAEAMNYWYWTNVWNIIWNSCWIWFLPCEYQNESTTSLY